MAPFGAVRFDRRRDERPRLFVVVDTEEEFDWGAPFSRAATSVTAMRQIGRVQRIFDAAGLIPTYVIDYPVATQREGVEALRDWARDGRCRLGAHLHPWVTPPHDEPVTGPNSFVGNLPAALQTAKLATLCDAVAEHAGVRPRVFKAGRYGISAPLLQAFERCGLEIDASVNPCMDFTAERGPDFRAFAADPFWFGPTATWLEAPCTHGFVGLARAAGRQVSAVAGRFEGLRIPGILARTGVLNRVMLSPEGNTLDEMMALTQTLLAAGLRTFSLTFHSPSVVPGHTPYVRTQGDLDAFLSSIERYLAFFLDELRGVASTPEAFRQQRLTEAMSS
jgi:hypothetical protein